MRKLLPVFFIFVHAHSYAQLGIKTSLIPNVKPVQGDYLYMAETEISNGQYRDFLNTLRKTGNMQSYWANLPDTLVWRAKLAYNEPFAAYYNEPFVAYYFQHPAYKDYPVVGVTQKQVLAFCHWYRDSLLHYLKNKNSPITDILVRLPTQKEWEHAARGGLDDNAIYPWKGDDYLIHNRKWKDEGKFALNTMNVAKSYLGGTLNNAGFITTPVYSYWPNGYGLYCMSGNVAEWLQEQGKTKGGAWAETPYYCRIDVPGKFDGDTTPRSTIGFRYVIEIVEVKSKSIAINQLNAKKIESEFAKMDSSHYTGITEVSNAWFQTFLQKSGNKFSPNDTLWLTKDKYKYHLMYSKNAIFKDYPVVNISRDAAIKYCEWLTEYYNKLPGRKYKKVRFRLPNNNEWEKAARGGRAGNSFPWPGPYIQNSKGKYLANHNPVPLAYVKQDSAGNYTVLPYDSSISRRADGFEFTAPVKSYFPNARGLYNVSGNAAEMIDSVGETVGGSWESEEYFLTIGHENNPKFYNTTYFPHSYIFEHQGEPLPNIGFRVFMEVLK